MTSSSHTRSRTINWHDPALTLTAMRREPGLEYLQKVLSGEYPPPPMGLLMNLRLAEVERGRIVFEATPDEYHYNPLGIVHGGFAATILDSAMGCAVHSSLDGGDRYTTVELKLNYVKPVTRETGPVRGIATLVHLGRRLAVAEGRLVDRDHTLYAHATSTLLVKRAEPHGSRHGSVDDQG